MSPAQRREPLHMLIFSGDVLGTYLPFSRYMAARLSPEPGNSSECRYRKLWSKVFRRRPKVSGNGC